MGDVGIVLGGGPDLCPNRKAVILARGDVEDLLVHAGKVGGVEGEILLG